MRGIEYLNSLPPWNGRGGFGLDNIIPVLEALGNPQDQLPIVHVGGTNGKGSVSCAVASILSEAGFRVGMTISPHLNRINERIVIDGREIKDAELDQCLLKVMEAIDVSGKTLTFHEAITAASFVAFVALSCNYAVVEVGLGGAYDATNVISRPKACAIVSISYDHTDILGDSLADIARAKAGIIKSGTHCVVGELPGEAFEVISRRSRELGCDWSCFGVTFKVERQEGSLAYLDSLSQFPISLALNGDHQLGNMGIALRIGRILGASEEECQKGVANCRWPGRAERIVLTPNHDLVFDCAHNIAGIDTLVAYAKSLLPQERHILFGALETKDWQQMACRLMPIAETWTILRPDSSRAVDPVKIFDYLKEQNQKVENLESDYDEAARKIRGAPGHWLVSGSIYMVGKLRGMIVSAPTRFWGNDPKIGS